MDLEKSTMSDGGKKKPATNQKLNSWNDIIASNPTNRYIISKFMRLGFTHLSAEELACTINPDFTIDFEKNTNEKWMEKYHFKVVERLQRCKFNVKWATKPSTGSNQFFDVVKTGDIDRVIRYVREQQEKPEIVVAQTDKRSGRTALHYAVEEG